MTTEVLNIGEYRKKLSFYSKRAREKKIKYIILINGKPNFEVNPLYTNTFNDDWDTQYTEEDHKAWLEAKKELENGEALEIDFDKVKTFEDFENLLNSRK